MEGAAAQACRDANAFIHLAARAAAQAAAVYEHECACEEEMRAKIRPDLVIEGGPMEGLIECKGITTCPTRYKSGWGPRSTGWTPIATVKQKPVKKQTIGSQKLSILREGKDSRRTMESGERRFARSVVRGAAPTTHATHFPRGKDKSCKLGGKSKGESKKQGRGW